MDDYKTYSMDILLNDWLFRGMPKDEMEQDILEMLREKDPNIFKVNVDVIYMAKPTIKDTIKVRVFIKVKE